MTAGAFKDKLRAARAQCLAGAGSVLDVLHRAGDASPDLAALLYEVGGVALLDAQDATPDFSNWSRDQSREARGAVVRTVDGRLMLAAEDPWNQGLLDRMARKAGETAGAAAVSRQTLQAWLGEPREEISPAQAPPAAGESGSPIVQFVDQAVQQAYAAGASDVHFECDLKGVTVKLRVDGILARHARLDGRQQADEVISRLKVMARLDITERRLPQDGRFRITAGGADIDVRVSIMPSVHAEDAVLRLLDKAQLRGATRVISLDHLGFASEDAARIRALAARPSGMLLITGPTGSGKTTTVYAALAEINTGTEKIITIEDPVEYELPGVLQIPVNEKKGLTFARGLRSILRHDPDRILVGEIRDAETADIAVQSALTGHLVFTTVHANSVGDIIGRFRHFAIDMFGFMSALNGVVVQRLLRALCPHCRAMRRPTPDESRWLALAGVSSEEEIGSARGCPNCHGAGYRGRFVVAEVHEFDDTVRDLVTEGAPLSAIKAHARARGGMPLAARTAQEVLSGRTTVEEAQRVVGLPAP